MIGQYGAHANRTPPGGALVLLDARASEGLLEHAAGGVDRLDLLVVEGGGRIDVQDTDDTAVHRQRYGQFRDDAGNSLAVARVRGDVLHQHGLPCRECRSREADPSLDSVEHLPLSAPREEPQHAGPFDIDTRQELEVLVEVGCHLVRCVVPVNHLLDPLAERPHDDRTTAWPSGGTSLGGAPVAGLRPAVVGPGQEVTLYQVDTDGAKGVELLAGFDTFGERRDAALPGESHETTQHGQLVGVAMGLVHKAAIDLDVLGMELDHVRHARVARADVVDGQHRRRGGPRLQPTAELVVVRYRFVLGDLDHSWRQSVQYLVKSGIEQRAWAQVDEEADVFGRRALVAGRLQAGQFEFRTNAEIGGVREPLVRSAAARDRTPSEQLIAEERPVGEPDDGLRGHIDRPGSHQFLHQPGERVPARRRGRDRATVDLAPCRVFQLCANGHDVPGAVEGVGGMKRSTREVWSFDVAIGSQNGCQTGDGAGNGCTGRTSSARRRLRGCTGWRSCACVGDGMAGHCQSSETLGS